MKRKKGLTIIGIFIVLCAIIGASYAYWLFTRNQTTMNKLLVGCFTLSLSDEQNDINLQKTYPISDEEGASLVPYSFTITNTCDLFADYTINLEVLEETTLDSKYIRVMLNNEAVQNLNEYESTTTSIAGSLDSKVLAKGSLGSGDSADYTLRLWLDGETGPYDTEAMNRVVRKLKMWYNLSARYERRKLESSLYGVTLIHI